MNLNDFEIYKGKSFATLCKDIVTNQNNKRDQLDVLIDELRKYVKSVNDAIIIIPMIRDYFDIGVKNDEQLVKLAMVIQRIVCKGNDAESGDALLLTDDERKQLMEEVETVKKLVETPIKISNKKEA